MYNIYFKKLFCIRIQLIYNVVLVSSVQQSASVIHICMVYIYILFQVRFLFRLLQNIEQSSLCYMCAESFQLSLTLCDPMQPTRVLYPWDSPARTLEWVAISSSRESFNTGIEPRPLTSPTLAASHLPLAPPGKPLCYTVGPCWLSVLF